MKGHRLNFRVIQAWLTDPDQDWRDSALCAQVDSELFFPPKGASPRPAKELCARCPVTQQCLSDALEKRDQFGIRGGTTAFQRRRMLAERGEGEAA